MRALILGLLMGAMLCACAVPQIYRSQLEALDKGMSPAEVTTRLKLAPSAVHTASAGARSFEFYQYLINNGVQLDRYLIVFEGGKLVYWGYLDELRKHPDSALVAATGQVAPAVTAKN